MRKSNEEISREVFGRGTRMLGWKSWFVFQPFFKEIERQVERSKEVGSRKDMLIKGGVSASHFDGKGIYLKVDSETGYLVYFSLPGANNTELLVYAEDSVYCPSKEIKKPLVNIFDDPQKPSFEELDAFTVIYGNEDVLLDIAHEFSPAIIAFNKSAVKNSLSVQWLEKWF